MRNTPTFKTLVLVSLALTALIGCDSKSAGTPPAHGQPPADPLPAVIHGHRLPPEPDPKVNNATLLGVDVNHNGVRDDVERWIYATYKDKHPIYIDIAMQGAKAKQKILKDPSKAKEIHDEVRRPLQCESYFRVCIDNPIISKPININKEFKGVIFNTKERLEAYRVYDTLLSGDSYSIPWCSERKQKCDFNTSKYED